MSGAELAFTALIFLVGGLIKGVVGFALPLVAMAGMTLFLPAKTAIAILLVPIFFANIVQAVESGPRKAAQAAWRFRPLILTMMAVAFIVALNVARVEDGVLYLFLGLTILLTAAVQLLGWRPRIPPRHERTGGIIAGLCGGFMGGLAGSWGSPVALYLLGLGVDRDEQVRTQGLAYFLGATLLLTAHTRTGLFDMAIAPVSAAMLVPTLIGLRLGRRVRGRFDEATFRRAVLLVMVVMGANMVRKGLTG